MKKIVASVAVAATTLALLTACGKKDEAAKAEEQSAPSLSDASSAAKVQEAAKAKVEAAAPKGDPNTPLDKFQEMDSGNKVMFAYLAADGGPLDSDEVLGALDSRYRGESDQFKKKDMAEQLKPRIQKEVAAAKSSPYYYIDIDESNQIKPYDFKNKSFTIDFLAQKGSYRYFNDNSAYRLSFANGEKFSELQVADEAKAREIESLRNKYTELRLRIYFYAGNTEIGQPELKGEILRVQLLDKKKNVLAEMPVK